MTMLHATRSGACRLLAAATLAMLLGGCGPDPQQQALEQRLLELRERLAVATDEGRESGALASSLSAQVAALDVEKQSLVSELASLSNQLQAARAANATGNEALRALSERIARAVDGLDRASQAQAPDSPEQGVDLLARAHQEAVEEQVHLRTQLDRLRESTAAEVDAVHQEAAEQAQALRDARTEQLATLESRLLEVEAALGDARQAQAAQAEELQRVDEDRQAARDGWAAQAQHSTALAEALAQARQEAAEHYQWAQRAHGHAVNLQAHLDQLQAAQAGNAVHGAQLVEQIRALQQTRHYLLEQVDLMGQERDAAQARSSTLEDELGAARDTLDAQAATLSTLRDALRDTSLAAESLSGQLDEALAERDELWSQLDATAGELSEMDARLERALAVSERHAVELEAARQSLAASRDRAREVALQLEQSEIAVANLEKHLARTLQEAQAQGERLNAIAAERDAARAELSALHEERDGVKGELATTDSELQALRGEVDDLRGALERATAAETKAQQRAEQTGSSAAIYARALGLAGERIDTLRANLDTARQQAASAQAAQERLQTQGAELERLQAARDEAERAGDIYRQAIGMGRTRRASLEADLADARAELDEAWRVASSAQLRETEAQQRQAEAQQRVEALSAELDEATRSLRQLRDAPAAAAPSAATPAETAPAAPASQAPAPATETTPAAETAPPAPTSPAADTPAEAVTPAQGERGTREASDDGGNWRTPTSS